MIKIISSKLHSKKHGKTIYKLKVQSGFIFKCILELYLITDGRELNGVEYFNIVSNGLTFIDKDKVEKLHQYNSVTYGSNEYEVEK